MLNAADGQFVRFIQNAKTERRAISGNGLDFKCPQCNEILFTSWGVEKICDAEIVCDFCGSSIKAEKLIAVGCFPPVGACGNAR